MISPVVIGTSGQFEVVKTLPKSLPIIQISESSFLPVSVFLTILLYLLPLTTIINNKEQILKLQSDKSKSQYNITEKSTPLPSFGILGDRINEYIGIFLDALAVYVHNDLDWDCARRMLCEANQRAVDNGIFHSFLMYFASLSVSLFLQNQKVSSSMEAMKRGRDGDNCVESYSCPFSL